MGRVAALCVALSVAWALALFATRTQPSVALAERNSDHYSHVSAAALAVHHGRSLWAAPVRELCEQPQRPGDPTLQRILEASQAMRVAPPDVCWVAAGWARAPLAVNWMDFPRPYPPGNTLLFAPVGLAYAAGHLSFSSACAIAMALILLGGHLAIAAMAWALEITGPAARRDRSPAIRLARLLVWAMASLFVLGWSLAGFYDGWAIAAVTLAALAYRRNAAPLALIAWALACFMHYRALWFFPLGAWAMRESWRAHVAGSISATMRRALLAALTAGVASALCLAWLAPSLGDFPVNHRFSLDTIAATSPLEKLAFAGLVISAGLGAMRRAPMLAACALSALAFVTLAPQAMPWHAISLVPLLALAPDAKRVGSDAAGTAWLLAILLWIFAAAKLLFATSLWPAWLADLAARV